MPASGLNLGDCFQPCTCVPRRITLATTAGSSTAWITSALTSIKLDDYVITLFVAYGLWSALANWNTQKTQSLEVNGHERHLCIPRQNTDSVKAVDICGTVMQGCCIRSSWTPSPSTSRIASVLLCKDTKCGIWLQLLSSQNQQNAQCLVVAKHNKTSIRLQFAVMRGCRK